MFEMPIINMTATGKNIENLRKQRALSVKDLQGIFDFSTPNAIYKWQRGIAMPTIDNLVVLATIFQVQVDDILVLDESRHVFQSA
ncbi:MAG: helix-turn-helix transcriptional regulator [Lachnospiraceae bacterium]|nr:helix-turn-helix transcriptional regulator [Lachnospiraceae bacterium]